MNTKHSPARTADEIFDLMIIEMPYHLPSRTEPYIKEAMQIYAKEQNAELLEALQRALNDFRCQNWTEETYNIIESAIKKATE